MAKRARYALHGGDAAEWRMVDHPYYDPRTVTGSTPQMQRDKVIEDFSPIKSRLMVMLEGNHEYGLQRWGCMTEELCSGLSTSKHTVIPGTHAAVIQIHDKKGLMYKIFATHGAGTLSSNAKDWEQQQANMKAALKMKLQDLMGDCLVMGMWHTHRLLIVPPSERLYLMSESEKIKQHYLHKEVAKKERVTKYIPPDRRWYVNGGSFLKLYQLGVSGYAERKLYKPVELGFANIVCRDRTVVDIEKKVV